jgi:hypothetical protein
LVRGRSKLFLLRAPSTSHLRNPSSKLSITSRTQLARLALGDARPLSGVRVAAVLV